MTVNTLHPSRNSRPAIAPTRADTEHQSVDLCDLDYYERRRRLFAALRTLAPGEEVQLISDRADDVSWLRYEMEARMPQRYCWSLPQESHGTTHTTVRLPRRLE